MDEMKLEAVLLAQEARYHRNQERKFARKERRRKANGKNFSFFDMARQEHYAERMVVRKEARYIQLARAWLKGTDYRVVEETTREGNEPDVACLALVLHEYGFNPPATYINQWIEGEVQ
jgi:hypothetical protein